jgi:hypothetical protein
MNMTVKKRKTTMDDTTKEMFSSLKELIEQKFKNLDEKMILREENTNLQLKVFEGKYAEHSSRLDRHENEIKNINEKLASHNRSDLESEISVLKLIKKSIISWIVPFVLGLFLLWAQNGFKIKG